MTSRACSSCNNSLGRSEYSKNQWSKGPAAKCKGCVAGKSAPPAPTSKIEEKEVVKKEEPETPVVDNKAEEEAEKKKKDEE